jgi:hypothetical protein
MGVRPGAWTPPGRGRGVSGARVDAGARRRSVRRRNGPRAGRHRPTPSRRPLLARGPRGRVRTRNAPGPSRGRSLVEDPHERARSRGGRGGDRLGRSEPDLGGDVLPRPRTMRRTPVGRCGQREERRATLPGTVPLSRPADPAVARCPAHPLSDPLRTARDRPRFAPHRTPGGPLGAGRPLGAVPHQSGHGRPSHAEVDPGRRTVPVGSDRRDRGPLPRDARRGSRPSRSHRRRRRPARVPCVRAYEDPSAGGSRSCDGRPRGRLGRARARPCVPSRGDPPGPSGPPVRSSGGSHLRPLRPAEPLARTGPGLPLPHLPPSLASGGRLPPSARTSVSPGRVPPHSLGPAPSPSPRAGTVRPTPQHESF